jgi:hypothetical protein
MSKNQVKSIVLSALKVSSTVLLFLSKAIVYLCIAIVVVGQLLFQEYAQSAPIAAPGVEVAPIVVPDVEPAEVDVWEWAEPIPVQSIAKTIARPAVLVVEVPEVVQESIALDVDRYQDMTSPQLRQECGKVGIQWRSVHGKNKHLSKAEMLAALAA